jgi:hypothetical protein
MDKVISEAQLHWVQKRQVAEASSLELAPGQWPERVQVYPAKGSPRLFTRKLVKRGPEMDVLYVDYETAGGRQLRIFND